MNKIRVLKNFILPTSAAEYFSDSLIQNIIWRHKPPKKALRLFTQPRDSANLRQSHLLLKKQDEWCVCPYLALLNKS